MSNIIKVKSGSGAPSALENGELGFDAQNGVLYIGRNNMPYEVGKQYGAGAGLTLSDTEFSISGIESGSGSTHFLNKNGEWANVPAPTGISPITVGADGVISLSLSALQIDLDDRYLQLSGGILNGHLSLNTAKVIQGNTYDYGYLKIIQMTPPGDITVGPDQYIRSNYKITLNAKEIYRRDYASGGGATDYVILDSSTYANYAVPIAGGIMTGELSMPRLRIPSTVDASETSTNHPFQVGETSGPNTRIDNNEIFCLNNGVGDRLNLGFKNGDSIGDVRIVGRLVLNSPSFGSATAPTGSGILYFKTS